MTAPGRTLDFEAAIDCAVELCYCPGVPIVVVRGEDCNMKVTEPIDLVLADRLLQLASQHPPTTRSEADQPAARQGNMMAVLGGTSGIG